MHQITTVDGLRIGELAERTGLTVRTLHHYDQIGLLRASERTEAGHRRYSEADVRRQYQVVALRSLGVPLARIARALEGDFSRELFNDQADEDQRSTPRPSSSSARRSGPCRSRRRRFLAGCPYPRYFLHGRGCVVRSGDGGEERGVRVVPGDRTHAEPFTNDGQLAACPSRRALMLVRSL